MHFLRLTLLSTLGLFFTACGGETKTNNTAVQSATDTATITVDAGKDKRIKINKTLTIEAKAIENQDNVSSYVWKDKDDVLATTRSFTYTPTRTGVHTLDFSVLYNNGKEVKDSIKIIVTSTDIDVNVPVILGTLKIAYLKAVNNARTQPQDCDTKGSFPATTTLKWNDKLYKAAYEHMQDLIASKTFAHEGSGTESDWTGYALGKKSDLIERAENYNYAWSRLGENLGGGTNLNEAEEMVQAWLESDNHCSNLMNPNFKELGMAMIKDENALYTHYWGQNFGTPK